MPEPSFTTDDSGTNTAAKRLDVSQYITDIESENRGVTDAKNPTIFISYSRKDQKFVRRLREALLKNEFNTWIDWADIPPTTKWLPEILSGIERADTFISILSPDSALSKMCRIEFEYADQQHKRIILIQWRDVSMNIFPDEMVSYQAIPFPESDSDDYTFQNAFDKLIEGINKDLPWVRRHTRLLVRAIEWEGKMYDTSLLLRGNELRDAKTWHDKAEGKSPTPNDLHQKYLRASHRAAIKRLAATLFITALSLTVMVGLSILYSSQRNETQSQREQARLRQQEIASRQLADESLRQMQANPDLGLLLAIKAAQRGPTVQAEDALRQSLAMTAIPVDLASHEVRIEEFVISPDSSLIITIGADDRAILSDTTSGNKIAVLNPAASAAFSPDSKLVVTASGWANVDPNIRNTARIWDAHSGRKITTLSGHDNSVISAVFSPDGQLIITASNDNTARVWEAESASIVAILKHANSVMTAAFSPNGKFIATGDRDGKIQIWETGAWKKVATSSDSHSNPIAGLVFSPNSQFLVTRSNPLPGFDSVFNPEDFAQILEVPSGKKIASLVGHGCFAPKSSFIRKALIEQLGVPVEGRIWCGVQSLTVSPDSQTIATGGADGKVRIWANSGERRTILEGHIDPLGETAFSPDGRLILTASSDPTLRLWETALGKPSAILKAPEGLSGAAFSPDCKFIALTTDRGQTLLYKCELCGTIGELMKSGQRRIMRPIQPEEHEKLSDVVKKLVE